MAQDSSVFTDNGEPSSLVNTILDLLIPASTDGKIPAAGALGIGNYLVRIARADAATGQVLEHGFKHASELLENAGIKLSDLSSDQQVELVRQLEQQEPAFFAVLLRITYMGYYSRPDIRPLFGLSSQPTQPGGYDVPIESPGEITALTRAVKTRGQCYRTC